jgi:hypothetical protein
MTLRTFSIAGVKPGSPAKAAIHGHDKATDALERVTGTRHLHAVPKDKTLRRDDGGVGGRCIFDGMFARRPEVRRSRWLS